MEPRHIRNIKLLAKHVKGFPKISAARIGAMLVYDKTFKIIGGNSYKSHPFQARFADHIEKITLHAEVNVIQKMYSMYFGSEEFSDMSKCTLYICRLAKNQETNKLELALAKPCDGCMQCITAFNIKKVIYTTGNEDEIKFL